MPKLFEPGQSVDIKKQLAESFNSGIAQIGNTLKVALDRIDELEDQLDRNRYSKLEDRIIFLEEKLKKFLDGDEPALIALDENDGS